MGIYLVILKYMANGPPLVDVQQARTSSELRATNKNSFTPFSNDMLRDAQATISRSPESRAVTVTEPPRFQEDPTISMSPQDKALADQLIAQVMDNPEPKKQQEAVSQIEKSISQEKKQQGFWIQFKEVIQSFFRNLFR